MPLGAQNPNVVCYWKPHPASLAAFLIEGFSILASDPGPSCWLPRLSIDRQPPELRWWYARHDPFLKAVEDGLTAAAVTEVAACGIDVSTPAAKALVDKLVAGERAAAILREQYLVGVPGLHDLIYLPAQALAGFCLNTPRKNLGNSKYYAHVAEELNDGIPSHQKKEGLYGRHVQAGFKRNRRDLIALMGTRRDERFEIPLMTAVVDITHSQARNLTHLYREARRADPFRGIKGAALAQAIHANAKGDLFFHANRVDEMFRRALAAA